MKQLRLIVLVALLFACRVASAQGLPPTVTAGGAPSGSAGPAPIDPTLDLPIIDPKHEPAPIPSPPAAPPVDPTDTEKPPTIYGHDLKSPNQTIFYVIDVSGSMGWDMGQYTTPDGQTAQGCRLDRAKSELTKSVMSLPTNFKFNMLSYDCDVYQWQGQMVPADDAHKQEALGWIGALQPQGATGTGPAVSSALADRQNMLVVLLTDGAPNCGAGDESGDDQCLQAHRRMIAGSNAQKAVINVFAIGATGDFEAFCQGVASDSGGSCTDVH